jgi:hypothetical protein
MHNNKKYLNIKSEYINTTIKIHNLQNLTDAYKTFNQGKTRKTTSAATG